MLQKPFKLQHCASYALLQSSLPTPHIHPIFSTGPWLMVNDVDVRIHWLMLARNFECLNGQKGVSILIFCYCTTSRYLPSNPASHHLEETFRKGRWYRPSLDDAWLLQKFYELKPCVQIRRSPSRLERFEQYRVYLHMKRIFLSLIDTVSFSALQSLTVTSGWSFSPFEFLYRLNFGTQVVNGAVLLLNFLQAGLQSDLQNTIMIWHGVFRIRAIYLPPSQVCPRLRWIYPNQHVTKD